MPSTGPAPERGESIPREVRPLPSAPSLKYERKEAKALLKQIHKADADALARVQATHPVALRDRVPKQLKLADAQHVIAREYGFTSWPRLVEYFDELDRHRHSFRHNSPDDTAEQFELYAQWLVKAHSRGDQHAARELAHYVPRFYGQSLAMILATTLTSDDARLVVARRNRRASWDELIERARAAHEHHERRKWEGPDTPAALARAAIRAHDVVALAAILDEHSELLTPTQVEREWRMGLAGLALSIEQESQTPDARKVTDLLASRGVDVQRELNERLLGWPQFRNNPVRALRWHLDRSADPNWMPPNGITVLEHAIVRYENSECVDLIAERVTPRRALWIAAGLDDVGGVQSFIAGKGRLTAEGRKNRPDLVALGAWFAVLPHQDADDLEIMWEAFEIAGWLGRWKAMDQLLEGGLPIDHAPYGAPLLIVAIGNVRVPLVEYLVSRGADLDRVWAWPENSSARTLARRHVQHLHDPTNERVRRMLEVCGAGTVEESLAEKDARRVSPPPPDERALRVMQLAADDAGRQGQQAVTTENMLVAFLRLESGVMVSGLMGSGADMAKLKSLIGDRLLPDEDPLMGQDLPADTVAAAALHMASAEADSRHREYIHAHHLLLGILSQEDGPGATLLGQVGTDQAKLWGRLKQDC